MGEIKAIIYDENSNPPDLPLYVMVKFDKFDGPEKFDKCPLIISVEKKCNEGTIYSRIQSPLVLAHCITIHNPRGLTLAW